MSKQSARRVVGRRKTVVQVDNEEGKFRIYYTSYRIECEEENSSRLMYN